MKKRLLALLLCFVMVVPLFACAADAARTGWSQEKDGSWTYYDTDGSLHTGWLETGGSWYYLDGSGRMLTGWQNVNGVWYYFFAGGQMATGWVYIRGGDRENYGSYNNLYANWFFFENSGALHTGWLEYNGWWYYFDDDTGAMYRNMEFLDTESGLLYLTDGEGHARRAKGWTGIDTAKEYDRDGKKVSGWQKIGGSWYYFSAGGAMRTGWFKDGGSWYYLSKEEDTLGYMRTGWQTIDGKRYYFRSGGQMVSDGWLKTGGSWYYLGADGAMLADTTRTINGVSYTFAGNGRLVA